MANVSRDFLRSSQRGDLEKLRELSTSHKIQDWTVYRHESTGDTALHIAAREGHLKIAKYLCYDWPYPAFKVDVANKDMKRPLHDASQFARTDIVEFLIGQGAEVDSLKRADWTPLMLASTKSGKDAKKSVDILLKAGANPNIRNKDGWTSLLLACRTGDVDIMELLLQQPSVDVCARSHNGRNGLHIAAFHGCLNAVKLLLTKNPELINMCDNSGSTALHESVKSPSLEVFEYLIKFGDNPKKVDTLGQTVLHTAASVGNKSVIQYILNNKLIDSECKDNYGATPLIYARRSKMDDIVKIFEKIQRTQLT